MSPFRKPPQEGELLEFMLLYSKHYLASGGPTSRLEDSLVRLGASFGKRTEVFCTPTGTFVSIQEQGAEPKTSLLRIKESGTDLGRLSKLEQILGDLMAQKISVHAALETIRNPVLTRSLYSQWQSALAAFLAGFVINFNAYQKVTAGLISGAITVMIWFLTTQGLQRHLANPLFTDFIAAFLTLTLAALAHSLVTPLSIEAYALGGIVMLVPGLALTTAIAELAEQNLVSGTAKLMQATLALLALALAYLLFQQIAYSLGLRDVLLPAATRSSVFWLSAIGMVVNISCFSVIFKTPPKALLFSTLTGLAGWGVLQFFLATRAEAAAPFLASVTVGMVSLAFGGLFRQPSQLYSVPGIVAMLPGMLALSGFRYFASGQEGTGIAFGFKVAITAASIVFGLMTARLPFIVMGSRRLQRMAFLRR